MIQAGVWTFNSWLHVDLATGVTQVVYRVYKRTTGGTETELFNVTTPEINNTTPVMFDVVGVLTADEVVDATDRIVIKLFAKTTSAANRTVTLTYEGSTPTHVHTSLAVLGATGPQGDPGEGVPVGGTTGQVLAKNSNTDYDTEWIDPPAGSGGGFEPRDTTTVTTASLSSNNTENVSLTLKPGYRVLCIETDRAARVRAYGSSASRTADAARPVGVDPTGAHGVIFDVVTTASTLTWWLNPAVDGYTTDGTDTVPVAITNLDVGSGTVTVDVTWVRSE